MYKTLCDYLRDKEEHYTRSPHQEMGSIFGTQKTLNEIVRDNQRVLRKAIRELEKEISELKKNEVTTFDYILMKFIRI